MARVQPGLCHIANSLPLCQGEQLVMRKHEQKSPPTPSHRTPPRRQTNTQIPAPFHFAAIRHPSPFPQVASTSESCSTGKHIMSVFISRFCLSCPLLEASVCRRVCLRARWAACSHTKNIAHLLGTMLRSLPTRPRTTGTYQGL